MIYTVIKMADNYNKLFKMWHDNFRQMENKEEKASELGIPIENGCFKITYCRRSYEVDIISGDITPLEATGKVPFYDAMFIYHLFWFSKKNPVAAREYIPFKDIPTTGVFDAAFQRSVKPLAERFNGRIDAFCKACESLGAEKLPYGDAGYSIPIWRDLYLQIILWDGDDEFPASVNVLFDKNIADFTHPETVVTIGDDAILAVLNADK